MDDVTPGKTLSNTTATPLWASDFAARAVDPEGHEKVLSLFVPKARHYPRLSLSHF